jgi:hypothetical protein
VATTGDDDPTPLAERGEFLAVLAEPDGKKALALGVMLTATLLERAGPVVMAAYESVGLEEELSAPNASKRSWAISYPLPEHTPQGP